MVLLLSNIKLPTAVIDAHHHFLDTTNVSFQSFLSTLVPHESYLPHDYHKDVVETLHAAGIELLGSVHVECMPDNGAEEAAWVESLSCTVKAIVGSCDLASASAEWELERLVTTSPKLRGVRWILDCVGPFEPNTATHIATTRHDGIDYLRGSHGDYEGHVVPDFERGFALLEKHGLSFDLQCAPIQLMQASKLFARYPNIPVCINHLGKPRTLLGTDESTSTPPNEEELRVWRQGLQALSKLPHVYIKISMLGFAIPEWTRTPERVAIMRGLVREVIDMFGAHRCMVALNWWKDGAGSDSDGLSSVGPDPIEFLRCMSYFFEGYTEHDRDRLFVGTAREFYRF
jgi:predicted TIM-barrel fold metal-dependent hydrolase